LRWAFNFTPRAGGRGCLTLQFVEFHAQAPGAPRGVLLLAGYPPLPYELSADGKELYIANFSPHIVRRLDSWEWEIGNENVTFVSCVGDDPQYNERGFQQPFDEHLALMEEDFALPAPSAMRRLLQHLEEELPHLAAPIAHQHLSDSPSEEEEEP